MNSNRASRLHTGKGRIPQAQTEAVRVELLVQSWEIPQPDFSHSFVQSTTRSWSLTCPRCWAQYYEYRGSWKGEMRPSCSLGTTVKSRHLQTDHVHTWDLGSLLRAVVTGALPQPRGYGGLPESWSWAEIPSEHRARGRSRGDLGRGDDCTDAWQGVRGTEDHRAGSWGWAREWRREGWGCSQGTAEGSKAGFTSEPERTLWDPHLGPGRRLKKQVERGGKEIVLSRT